MRKSYHEQRKVRCVVVATRSTLNCPVPNCPFCYANGRLAVLAHYPVERPVEEATAYLVLAKDAPNVDDYLVIPAEHVESEGDLPDDFTAACKYLRLHIPWMEEATADPRNPKAAGYHTGTNYGVSAGQTLVHVHQWYSRVPAGHYVAGIATHTHQEVVCRNVTGQGRQEFLQDPRYSLYHMLVTNP